MSFIRMRLVWFMVVLSEWCSGSDEIPLERATQSSTKNGNKAANSIDNNLNTFSTTNIESPAWMRVYFEQKSIVDKVVVEKGYSGKPGCEIKVSVYDGKEEKVCGTYTGKPEG